MLKKVLRKAINGNGALDPADLAAPTDAQARPTLFFVSGHPRSGTNWISSLINLHPDLYCDGEFHFQRLREAMDEFTTQPWLLPHAGPARAAAEASFNDLVRRCLTAQAGFVEPDPRRTRKPPGKPSARAIGDHSPRPLRLVVPPPEGKYIVIVRDGRDVLVSWTYHLVRFGQVYLADEAVQQLLTAEHARQDGSDAALRASVERLLGNPTWVGTYAAKWAEHVRQDAHAADEIDAAFSPSQREGGAGRQFSPVLRLQYEHLHANAEAQRQHIYRFLGVDPARALPLSAETQTTPGFNRDQPREFFRKGAVGDYQNYLSPAMLQVFEKHAGAVLADFGYELHQQPVGVS